MGQKPKRGEKTRKSIYSLGSDLFDSDGPRISSSASVVRSETYFLSRLLMISSRRSLANLASSFCSDSWRIAGKLALCSRKPTNFASNFLIIVLTYSLTFLRHIRATALSTSTFAVLRSVLLHSRSVARSSLSRHLQIRQLFSFCFNISSTICGLALPLDSRMTIPIKNLSEASFPFL